MQYYVNSDSTEQGTEHVEETLLIRLASFHCKTAFNQCLKQIGVNQSLGQLSKFSIFH